MTRHVATATATESPGMDRLRALVAEAYAETVTTKSGIVKAKTAKQREIDKAVAEAVVRFAFDHGGYRGEHLAPAGLWDELMPKRCRCGGRDFASCVCGISISGGVA